MTEHGKFITVDPNIMYQTKCPQYCRCANDVPSDMPFDMIVRYAEDAAGNIIEAEVIDMNREGE